MAVISYSIWVTERCNMDCKYCYEGYKGNKVMSLETMHYVVEYISEQIRKNEVEKCNIHFHGGEPLLNYKIIDCFIEELGKIKEAEFVYTITSNGTILDEKILECLKKIQDVNISVDGDEDSHNKLRIMRDGTNSYKKIRNNISVMLKNGVDVCARMTCTKENLNKVYINCKTLVVMGIGRIINSIEFWKSLWTKEELEQYAEQIMKVKEYIIEKTVKCEIDDITATIYSIKGSCRGGISESVIDCEGNIFPCMAVYGRTDWKIGNTTTGIMEDWEKRLQSINKTQREECEMCEYKKYCAVPRCVFYTLYPDTSNLCKNICTVQNVFMNEFN